MARCSAVFQNPTDPDRAVFSQKCSVRIWLTYDGSQGEACDVASESCRPYTMAKAPVVGTVIPATGAIISVSPAVSVTGKGVVSARQGQVGNNFLFD